MERWEGVEGIEREPIPVVQEGIWAWEGRRG